MAILEFGMLTSAFPWITYFIFNFSSLPPQYKVVANIPYYLSSLILRLLLEAPHRATTVTLLVQKEVAERVTAAPGEMSVLSISVQYYAQATRGPLVTADKFTPQPKVDSVVLHLKPRSKPLFEADTKQFFRLVKAGFGERRKKLTNALAGGLHISSTQASTLLEGAHISTNARAQELSLRNWQQLYVICTQNNLLK